MWIKVFLCFLGYIIGSIPFGVVFTKLYDLPDLRKVGSGNVGATNAFRSGGKTLGLLTFLADALKAVIPVFLALFLSPGVAPIVAVFVVLGHIFPVWFRFKGGKGVATSFGGMLILSFPATCLAAILWILVLVVTRYASLASLITFLLFPFFVFLFDQISLLPVAFILLILIAYTHTVNIKRLFLGTELKINKQRED